MPCHRAAKTVTESAAFTPKQQPIFERFAVILAGCSALAMKSGFKDAKFLKGEAFDPLRDRTDFQDLVRHLKPAAESPSALAGQPNFSVCDKDGWHSPDTTYWPELHGVRAGALRSEQAYFTDCMQLGRPPVIITPGESRAAVVACSAAERSAATGTVIGL